MTGHIRFPFRVSAVGMGDVDCETHPHTHCTKIRSLDNVHHTKLTVLQLRSLTQVMSHPVALFQRKYEFTRQGRGRNGPCVGWWQGEGEIKPPQPGGDEGDQDPAICSGRVLQCVALVPIFRLDPWLPGAISPRLPALFLISNASQTCLNENKDDQGHHRAAHPSTSIMSTLAIIFESGPAASSERRLFTNGL
jgi:hypothetical protein